MLIKCSECGKEISDKAKFCPSCGVYIKNKIFNIRIYILLVVLLCSCYFAWRYNDLNSRFCGAGTFQGTMTQNAFSFGNKVWWDVFVLGEYKNICILDNKN